MGATQSSDMGSSTNASGGSAVGPSAVQTAPVEVNGPVAHTHSRSTTQAAVHSSAHSHDSDQDEAMAAEEVRPGRAGGRLAGGARGGGGGGDSSRKGRARGDDDDDDGLTDSSAEEDGGKDSRRVKDKNVRRRDDEEEDVRSVSLSESDSAGSPPVGSNAPGSKSGSEGSFDSSDDLSEGSSSEADSEEERQREAFNEALGAVGFNVEAELAEAQQAHASSAEHQRRVEHASTTLRAMYPAEWEQSDQFTQLLGGAYRRHASVEFLVKDSRSMDRLVRMTMWTALRLAGRLMEQSARRSSRRFTMRSVLWYINCQPPEYRLEYRIRVERILNSNGLSLSHDPSQPLDLASLAGFFKPVYEPTMKRCKCTRPCHEMSDPDPLSDNFCPCYSPERRRCGPHCYCGDSCELRKFDPALDRFLKEFAHLVTDK